MVVPENLSSISPMHWGEYQSNTRHNSIENDKNGVSVSTFVQTGSLYTGNGLGKSLIALHLYALFPLEIAVCVCK